MNRFFMAMQPPTKTFQDKIIAGKRLINSPEVNDIKDKFLGHLYTHRPQAPVQKGTPVFLRVTWCWEANQKNTIGYKTTKPDVDNLTKLLMDAMTKSKFWIDDSQVAHLEVIKVFDAIPGILIEWKEMEWEPR